MVTTRSKTSQAHIEEYAQDEARPKKSGQKAAPPSPQDKARVNSASKTAKRKSSKSSGGSPKSKRAKTVASPAEEISAEASILINRAPVLQLWAASVTHFLHHELPWSTCLSAGSAISAICAVAKGRSIGTIKDTKDKDEKKKQKEVEEREGDYDVLDVMNFKLRLKNGLVLVGSAGKGKPGVEEPLKAKFGGREYEAARKTFQTALESWQGHEDELNQNAFGLYERFRPNISSGQKGWGKKGELSFEKVMQIAKRQ
ncbi:hypothetical protein AOQ84DRAFT_166672 [Glonium stellatum]|uniref:Uncharacterized protein n=1 Tax=Glonium stellatum TaxID=574774 RepID=A0A8E2EQ85_9PEZI|nr:hypothetical protein AOQ84DRAFT_166672 [Glonium stellatum]